MRFSIITPVFNCAAYIESAILSVASQTYPDIEHVVVDGGSNDETLELLYRHQGRIANILHGPDGGIYDAMNKGVNAGTGDVIGFLSADDLYADETVIEEVAREIAAHSLDALYADIAFVRPDDVNKVVRVYSSHRFSPDRIGWGWMPAHPSLFVRRTIFNRFGLFKPEYRIAGDFEFVARVFSLPSIRYKYLPKVLVKMRTGGVSTRGWKNTVILNREVLRACRANGINTNYFKIFSKYPAKVLEFFRVPG